MDNSLALVVGAGEGLGESLVTTLSESGYRVVALNRTTLREGSVSSQDNIIFKQVDVSDFASLNNTMHEIIREHGEPSVVIHNPAQLHIKPFLDTSVEDFELAWRSMVLSAVNVLHTVIPVMLQKRRGAIIVSGATGSVRGGANFSAFASAKFALRGLTQSLAREYQKQGIHIAHVILDGILDTAKSRELHTLDPAKMMSTKDVAKAYVQLIQQPKSAWTHELDLRPQSENF
jgi:NAD(P)-dependent dehydrogenase (short-subunit alcohol dehydrogenase family)